MRKIHHGLPKERGDEKTRMARWAENGRRARSRGLKKNKKIIEEGDLELETPNVVSYVSL